MIEMDRLFRLARAPGVGVSCDDAGLFVGDVALLETETENGVRRWRPRPLGKLNQEAGELYGLPVEFASKVGGLTAVAGALNRGDLAYAQIVALYLRLPDPPSLAKAMGGADELVRALAEERLLKDGWDEAKHPRWPAGSPDSIGGQFAPSGAGGGAGSSDGAPILTPAQIAIPIPGEIPLPTEFFPIPSEIVLPPAFRGQVPRNPFPDREECEAEWAAAEKYCQDLVKQKKLGRGDHRGMGKTYGECLMGQVSEYCGGNSLSA